jgi:hypothetical protein
MANSNYNCSHQDLYTGGRIEWSLYNERWADFADYSGIYTETLGDEKLLALDAAERLPDKASRDALTTEVFRELGIVNKDAMHLYTFFKSYILRIYDPSVHDLKLAAIGDGYFTKANGGNWGSTTALLGQATPFLEDNLAELMSKNIIPAAFPNKLIAITKAFKDKYADYLVADKAATETAKEKIDANNAVYAPIADLNKVAQIIYKKDPDSAKLFVWTSVLAQTHGIRNAGVSGKVTIKDTKTVLAGVTMRIIETGKTMVTDKFGRFDMTPLSSGKYTMQIDREGYESQAIKVKINTGSTSRLNVEMVESGK